MICAPYYVEPGNHCAYQLDWLIWSIFAHVPFLWSNLLNMLATLKIPLEKHLALFFQTPMWGWASFKTEASSGHSHGFAGCFCFGFFLLARCTIILPQEVCLNSSCCFRGYELKNQTNPYRLQSENADSYESEPNAFFRSVFFNLQQVEIRELLLSTRKTRNNRSFL